MAISINQRRGPELTAGDFVALGRLLRVPDASVRRALQDLAARTDTWLDDLTALPFDSGKLRKLRRVILHRRDQLM